MDYKSSGVDIEAGNEVVRRIKGLARSTFTRGVLLGDRVLRRPLRSRSRRRRSGARRQRRRGRHEAQGGVPGRSPRHRRRGPRQPLRQRHPGAGGAAAVLPGLPGHRSTLDPTWPCRSSRASRAPAGPMDARCSVARPPRCPASTPTASTTSPGSSSALSGATRVIDGRRIAPGDVFLGLPSAGLHTNGYSLARRIVFDELGLGVDTHVAELGCSVADALLVTHRSYLPVLAPVLDVAETRPMVKGLAHITGGGITDNLPRILPAGRDGAHPARRVDGPTAVRLPATWRQRSRRGHAAYLQHGHRDDRGVRGRRRRSALRGARRGRRARRPGHRRSRRRFDARSQYVE